MKVIETIYGELVVNEPVLLELLASQAVQRLRQVHQFGVTHYLHKLPRNYTRYDHSVGVLYLLQRYKCSLAEQIAGLLHDASHTVFSHVADYLFAVNGDATISYQDHIHQWYLERTDVAQILLKYGYTLAELTPNSGEFWALEQDLPDLCIDRIEYTLHEYSLQSSQNLTDVQTILSKLHFDSVQKKWFFDDLETAQKYARLALEFTCTHWSSVNGIYTYTIAARMLKHALETKVLDYDQLHFGTDDEVWQILQSSSDSQIQEYLDRICYCEQAYCLSDINDYNLYLRGKFRGVDPYVRQADQSLRRLSEIDLEFAQAFTEVQNWVSAGTYVKERRSPC